ncbi:DHH phosphoesterase [Epithele typhae]|uniref:DHH phosphoesterase n=1 Tax=Epithele typhae TaxID=378194 RepID=UPI0020085401|nr:DHH phosphoesterase [Epithele typhae]KAH9927953.1 DHH phosphoesterase [Epithele typhae]
MASGPLSEFLKAKKSAYIGDVKAGKGKDWTVVMGNEAGDLDSIASSIAYSWFASKVQNATAVALTQTPRSDLHLRAENLHALELAHLDPSDILCIDDVPCASSDPWPSSTFALVDHNRLQSRFSRDNPDARVVAAVDHHQDEGLYQDSASPRTIVVPTGSCASLIALLFEEHPEHMTPDLATLLLCSILIDTSGLKPGGKAEATDRRAANFLLPILAASQGPLFSFAATDVNADAPHDTPGLADLHHTLQEKKASVAHLTTSDLLKRDYKEYTMTPATAPTTAISVGLSSVPVGFEAWLPKDAAFWAETEAFMAARGLAVLGILTSFRDADHPGKSGRGKHRREQMYVVRGDEGLAKRLFDVLGDAEELKLKRRKFPELGVHNGFGEGVEVHVWEQKNVDATRKVTAPLVKAIIEGSSKGASL